METFAEVIKKYRDTKNIEIEFRLGKVNHGTFDTNVGQKSFERILKGLLKYKEWEKVTESEDEVFYWSNGVRCIYNGNDSVYQKKTKIVTKDHTFSPLDIRLSVAQEIPVKDEDEDAQRSVTRKRWSFLRKNVRIDMTIVTGQSHDKDCEDVNRYQVELEVLDASSDQKIYSAVHKIINLTSLLRSP